MARLEYNTTIGVLYSRRKVQAKLQWVNNKIIFCIYCGSVVLSACGNRLFSNGRIEPMFRCAICNRIMYHGQGETNRKHGEKKFID